MNLRNEELEKIKATMVERTLPVDVAFVSDEVRGFLNMNQPMAPEKIIKNLTRFNDYRRGMICFDDTPTPVEIGITIERAIDYIREHEALDKAEKDDGK